jgi:hypothetical protein
MPKASCFTVAAPLPTLKNAKIQTMWLSGDIFRGNLQEIFPKENGLI